MFSVHNRIKLEINNRNVTENFPSAWKLNSTLINNSQVKEEISREIRKYIELNENESSYHKL